MHIDVDGAAFKMWLDRFVILREAAVPLTALTARVPRLVPARGSLESGGILAAYLDSCRELGGSRFPPSTTPRAITGAGGSGVQSGEVLEGRESGYCAYSHQRSAFSYPPFEPSSK
jgi:hypothetical protein